MNEILHNLGQAINDLKSGKIFKTEETIDNTISGDNTSFFEQPVIIDLVENSTNLPAIRQKGVITEGMDIVGDIHLIDSDLEVWGKIKGNIDCNGGNVYILNSCVGDTSAQHIILSRSASVLGNLEAKEVVQIDEGCTLKGNIKTLGSVAIKGTLLGNVLAHGDVYIGANSIISGDITSSTIETTKGARVNGAIKQLQIDVKHDDQENARKINSKNSSNKIIDKA